MSAGGEGPPAYPRATYRLQLNKDFRFEDARRIVPYLATLGISHVYLSPILMARPGSTHGYDIVDHNRLNPEIGEERDFDALVAELHRHGMGLILDFVPNHMFVGPGNDWWMDILEWGRASPFAAYVDIEWEPLEPTNVGKVVLPTLGDHYGAVLERGELTLRFDEARGGFVVGYFDNLFPISPRNLPTLLQRAAAAVPEAAEALEPLIAELAESLRQRGGRARRRARHERIKALKARLGALAREEPAVGRALAEAADAFNGTPGDPASFDALHWLLERQSYRLAFWRVAAHEINYRRFFDINELAGLRMEQPELFEASHRLVGRLAAEGKIQGLRLDHVDGLRDPKAYLARLRALAGMGFGFYVIVEKILAPGERLRPDWPVEGTTGYDFMGDVNRLFMDPAAEGALTRSYERFIRRGAEWEEIVVEAKRLTMRRTLASELNTLAGAFNRIAKRSRHTRDYTMTGFREALEDVIAHFPVYRTYAAPGRVTEEDRRIVAGAVDAARASARTADTTIYDFIRDVLTLGFGVGGRGTALRQAVTDTALKFQQYTGPVMAKSVEDTAFYRYLRFVALNEVGSEPDRFGLTPGAFHEAARERLARHPLAMLATATHDHKRGEDVRARLDVLSEMPGEWGRRVRGWARLNARHKTREKGREAPGPNDEYLLYQMLVGAWPLAAAPPDFAGLDAFRERVGAYMLKAAREAKARTSWAAPDEAYERALGGFVDAVLDPAANRAFLDELAGFVRRIAPPGAVNGLAQVALKLTAPGVPDIYQGTELWDSSLVDPDNRRPVDYAARAELLERDDGPAALAADWRDGAVKQALIRRLLGLRRAHPALFAQGAYRALRPAGPAARRLVAFARALGNEMLVTVVPRLASKQVSEEGGLRTRGWEGTRIVLDAALAGARFHDALTGREAAAGPDGSLAAEELFADLPVAVLYRG